MLSKANLKDDLNYLKHITNIRSSRPEVFLGKGVLKICSKLIREHPCRSVISIRLLCNFIEITLRHGCSPVNLLSIFRTRFTKNTSGLLLLKYGKRNSHLDKIIAKTNECVESIFSRKG